MNLAELNKVAQAMVAPGKGILAADESSGTIKKRFDAIGVESTEDNRRDYRELLFRSTEAMKSHISGVILYDETIWQKAKDGTPLVEIIKKADQIKLPENAETMRVLKGGPVETGRGFVLHSSDFFIEDATLRIDDEICLTATVDILKAIARGAGPKHAVLALGYAGWAAGQLESEIQDNGWLHCDADPDLIFGDDIEEKYNRALRKIGIDPGMLSNEAGHA